MIIALVGQDSKFCLELKDLLQSQGHRVNLVPDLAKASSRLQDDPPHMIVIDGVPSVDDALELIRTLRSHQPTRGLPILRVDPKGTPKDVVKVLDAGADDFLVRPFNGQIFLARVRTLLRRQMWSGAIPAEAEPAVTRLSAAGLELRLVERLVFVDGNEVLLTRLEFDLLAYLMKHPDEVLKRETLLEAVWKYPESVETRTLAKHVETLRKKLDKAGGSIRTVHGVGYRFFGSDAAPRAAR
ncbi:MAG: DNA-binding response regulator [Elusimicrobia bacterium CG_4_9_14_3_um_filter_62_55]|nr:MAG: DNA-binding response regulator [Elusimicrobia bacterium CG22_combo_CG10-13_8_21_14_all_63_91]PJA12307.1 MAG: DNA-binding response regulator [Elusimicrobia bacterium CG_4_10_14_0_2_um_filter_63_34]PJB24741.1 MAG: DNA-binding response regulator [Elusimicrobia bacterium CG_4_9_14_3_um_filter_62_55]